MKKILIVEDEKMLAEMYKDKLVQSGFDVILASDSREGLKLTKEERPNLILLDILLPRENGVSFLEKVRSDSEISSIPVLVFSNYENPETREKIRKLKAKDYLLKTSYTPQKIVEEIKKYLK